MIWYGSPASAASRTVRWNVSKVGGREHLQIDSSADRLQPLQQGPGNHSVAYVL